MALTPQDPHKAVITSVGSAIGGGTANSTKPVITGTADAGTTVDIFDGVRMIGTAIVASNGTWSFTPTADLKAGSHSFTAISVDSHGDMGASSTPMSVTVPGGTPVAPVKPVIDGGGPTDDQGHPLMNPTNDPRPEMSGTGTPGDTITMYDGNTPIGSTIIDSTGHWVVKPEKDLDSGNHDIYVIETNPAGVPSQPSDHYPVVIDTSVPAKPPIPTMTDDNGATIPAGSTTADAHPHINGTGTAGDTITVYDGSKVIGSTTVGGDGKWSFTPSPDLGPGAHDIHVIETNPAGTPSAASDPIHVVIDTGPPAKPSAPILTDDSGANIPAGSTVSDGHPHISGTGVAGDIITVYDGNTVLGSIMIGADGQWTFTPSSDLSAGSHSINVTETHPAGSSSAHSDAVSVIISTAPAIVSVIGTVGPMTGNIAPGGATTDTQPTLTGTGHTAGDLIKLYDGATLLGSTTVDANGTWSFRPSTTLSGGTHNVTATETNGAGQTSNASSVYSFSTGYIVVTNVTDAYGHTVAKGGSTSGPLTYTVYVDPSFNGATVGVYVTCAGLSGENLFPGGGAQPIVKNGMFTFTLTAPWATIDGYIPTSGNFTIDFTASQPAGAKIFAGTGQLAGANWPVDAQLLDAPVAAAPVLTDDSGAVIPAGTTTVDVHPHISGTGKAGDLINVYDNGTLLGSTTVELGRALDVHAS